MGGRGYSSAKADEVTKLICEICSSMFAYDQPWPPYMTPKGVVGLCGGIIWFISDYQQRASPLEIPQRLFAIETG